MASDKLDTADFFQAGIEGAKRMNVQIGLPVGVFVSPLYYNKKHLAEVEIEAPTSPDWTWDDLVAMAHKLTRQVDGQQRWGFHISSWFDLLIAPRVWANGGEVLNSDDTICLLDQPKAMGAIQWWYDLRNKEQVAPDPSQMASIKELGAFYFAFMAGMVSMGSEGTWCPAGFNSTPDLEWDMQVWPIPAGGKQAGVLGQDNISVTTRTSNAQPAWEWASFLTDKEAQQLRAEGGFWCPVRKSVAQDPKAQAGLGTGINYQGVFMELDTARPVCSNAVRWPEISDLLTPALDLIFGGQQAVDVLPPVVQQINDKLSKPPVE
jgi:multiple sugar transport system substrate-binding protein